MRYYDIQVTDSGGGLTKRWTSHPNGINSPPDPGALKVEIDAFNVAQSAPLPGSYVRVWGISLQDIGQAANLNGHDLTLYGGMGKGLPLANPSQSGVLIRGHIQQAFANWVGTTMTLDLILVAGTISSGTGAARNLVLNWPAKTPLADALRNCLNSAISGAKLNINISDKLILPNPELHFAGTLSQLAEYVVEISRKILNTGPALAGAWNTPNNALSTYPGVQIHVDGDTINIFDGTKPSQPKQISIYDLIGQPTWIGPQTIQTALVMRGDINVGDFIKLPPTRAVVTAASLSPYSQQRQDLLFQGVFQVTQVHHVGNYKDPNALSWVTVLDAIVQTQTGSDGASLQLTPGGPSQQTPVGSAGGDVTIGPLEIVEPEPSGLVSTPAPSLGGFSTVRSGTGPTEIPSGATAGDVGLKQSIPAPSLLQSIGGGGGAE